MGINSLEMKIESLHSWLQLLCFMRNAVLKATEVKDSRRAVRTSSGIVMGCKN